MAISPEEQARRAEALRQIRHSTEMSGGRLSEEAEHDLAEYVRGEVDEAEMLRPCSGALRSGRVIPLGRLGPRLRCAGQCTMTDIAPLTMSVNGR